MTTLTRRGRAVTTAAVIAATAVLTGAAGLVAGGSGSARAAGGAVVLDEGEVDLTPRPVDGRLQLQIDDRSGDAPVVREPSEVVLHVTPSTLQHTPSPLAEAFGLVSHDTWQLNGQTADDLFALEPGWNGSEAGGETEVRLSAFDGPAVFGMATYTFAMENNDEPPVMYLGGADPAPRAFTLDGGAQRHTPTWMFDAEGVYRLTFTVTGGGVSDTETLAVVVGDDVDPAGVLPGDGTSPAPGGPSDPASASGSTPPAASPPPAHVIGNGHLDLAARPVGGKLQFQVKQGTSQSYQWYEPGRTVLHVKPAALRRITEGFGFLGTVGAPVWWLPESQVDGLVWPGWNTEEYRAADVDGPITYRLDKVQGPGAVAMFNPDSLGAVDIRFHSGDGLPDSYALTAGRHSHFVWTFAAEGVYRTTLTVSATLADGTKVSDTETLAWVVGDDVDPSTVVPGAGDEPTAAPTASPSPPPSASVPGSAPATDAPDATDTATATAPATGSGAGSGAGSGSAGMSGGSSSGGAALTGGGLASTGSGAAVLAGIAAATVLLGGGAVIAARRRRPAR
ncbi:choice-of-anchor M domain-containing protein [Streptomyces sp. NPDC014995]|uniref:choice-of-anchor M domain-containing protein n=1 Tax=Streptomyces sp. NPDC014995 TaxID=3364936 RepID=UPI0036FC78D6